MSVFSQNDEYIITDDIKDYITSETSKEKRLRLERELQDAIYDEALEWYAELLQKAHDKYEYDEKDILEVIVAEAKMLPSPHAPEWSFDFAHIPYISSHEWNSFKDGEYMGGDIEESWEDIQYRREAAEAAIKEKEKKEEHFKKKILRKYETWSKWKDNSNIDYLLGIPPCN